LAIVGFCKRPSVLRGIGGLVVVILGAFQIFMVVYGSLLPKYEGPVVAGMAFPPFAAERAGGGTFTDADLRGQPTVLTFFRGRW
jgi:cytochrome oxidase Cu insertion factor (SCO1/SenC/PrrC family)